MSSIIIECPFCKERNLIPNEKKEQRSKCGACGQFISIDIVKNRDICELCNQIISDGIHLSNGRVIHESCLNVNQEKIKQIENEITEKNLKVQKNREEITRRQGILFKFVSLFSSPSTSIIDIERSIQTDESNIEKLRTILVSLQTRISSLHICPK